MSFEQRSELVRRKLVKPLKTYFEFKNHVVKGEFPEYGIAKDGQTKINVSQMTRLLLQVAQLEGAKVSYIVGERNKVFAPVKEPEDKDIAAAKHTRSVKEFTSYR
jgi:hypothetical protein